MLSKCLIIISIVLVQCLNVTGQNALQQVRSTLPGSNFVLQFGGALNYYLSNTGAPQFLHADIQRTHITATGKFIWYPGYRVYAAFETGVTTFYSYQFPGAFSTEGRLALSAIPFLLEFGVKVYKGLEVFAGPGVYRLNSKLFYEDTTISGKWSTGWVAGSGYKFKISKNLQFGTEVKWFYGAETVNGSLLLGLTAGWQFHK